MGEKISLSHDLATFNLQTQFINCFSYGIRSAVKNFGIERFKTNCHRATDGFNLVMAHLHTRQQYLKDMQMKKFQQIRQTGETVIARYGQKSNMFLLCINMTRHSLNLRLSNWKCYIKGGSHWFFWTKKIFFLDGGPTLNCKSLQFIPLFYH